MFSNKLLLLLINTVVSVYINASSNDKCIFVYPTKDEGILPRSTISLGDQISLKLDEHQLPVLVAGQLIKEDLHIDWLYLSTKETSFIIHVGVGNSIRGEEVLSGYNAKKRVQSEIGHVIVDLPTVDCKYDYVLFKICTYLESEFIEDKEACNPTQLILVEKENKKDMQIVTRETLEYNVELEFSPDISIEKNKLAFLECVVIQVDNQEDKLETYESHYYKKTGLNFVVAHTRSGNSNYMCLLLVSSPNYYQLYSTDIISFSIKSIGKEEHRTSINSTEEGKEKGNRFIRGMDWVRNPVIKRRMYTLRKHKMNTNKYDKYMKSDYHRMFEMKMKDLTQVMTDKVSSWAKKYLRNLRMRNLRMQNLLKKRFRKGKKKQYKKVKRNKK